MTDTIRTRVDGKVAAGAVLEFWFDYACPFAYLASTQVEALAERTGAKLVWQPMLLGGVFKANNTAQNLSEVLSPAKKKHNELDMVRWAERWGVPLRKPVGHPLRTVDALRATLASGIDPKVAHAFYRAYWVEGRDISQRDVVESIVPGADLDAHKDDLRVRTERAIELGVFGAPSFIVTPTRPEQPAGGELFWGQDRLHFVERALGGNPKTGDLRAPSRKHTLDVYFDFSSPFSYLGLTRAEAIATRTGAKLTIKPMLLGAVFKAIGTADAPMLTWSQAKASYYNRDLLRWAKHWGAPFQWPSRFPFNSVKALRVYLALPEERHRAFRDATYKAAWADDRDVTNDDVLRALIGADADTILARTREKEIKDALFAATKEAVDAGVFGAPTFVVDGEHLYWGQDRLALVEAKLRE